ncbi:nuclear transport factor 2 family protein [Novosphingobium album (ex Liu et al. 2023)]|uniref:Nuclear transport factor 2 family protein n=1 Tax=Novosphingobium album (ex Liu et al. 2023) TaxID=3031130 RepID=A0ABT5WSJ1_9SPHN|nr:nuclear transport factor 2 family protein [Novosphingobium album (ex Liu et al. 2023)]MDE8653016.1 nuclear transport factor 2 family protein [Novosphingobium album (ex Liu et al. 2023)]
MTDAQVRALAVIEQRLAACTQAGDARKADAYAECFTEDGVLQLDAAIAGREAIRAWMRGPSVIPQPGGGVPGFISHHLTTCRVEFTGEDSASARTYWLVTSAAGLDHNGYYVDALRRVGDAWLIAHRRPRTLWISTASVLRR